HYVTQYGYDAAGELTTDTDPAGRNYQFLYDDRGNLVATDYPNSTFSWSTIDATGRLTELDNRHGTVTSLAAGEPTDSSPIADYTYQYSQAGQKTQEILSASGQADQTTSYAYDGIGRLDQVALPDGTCRDYSYDADSNRTQIAESATGCAGTFSTTATYAYSPSTTPGVDQLSSTTATSGTTNYAYTADGQVKSYGTTSLTWDGWGRLSGAAVNGTSVTYHFDPAGGLKSRTSSGGANTRYLLGDLFETDSTGQVTTSYVDGPAGDLAQYSGPPSAGSAADYLYYNGHGDLAAETDGSG